VVFGAGLTLGNLVGGRLGDWRLMPSVIAIFVLGHSWAVSRSRIAGA